jgi:hypothetical protein
MAYLLPLRIFGYAAVTQTNDARRVFQQPLVVRRKDEGEAEAAIQIAHQID